MFETVCTSGRKARAPSPAPPPMGAAESEPTVADANIVLGRLHPDRFLGGQMKLDLEAARRAIMDRVGSPLGLSLEEAAAGIIRIANANMERAVRVSSAEKGFDPRDITLVAFGGAGPLHAAALAGAAGIPAVLVPQQPGVFSAVGLVMADIRHDFVRTRVMRGAGITADRLAPLYAELEAQARDALARDGVAGERCVLRRSADLRYVGQAYEVNVPVSDGPLDPGSTSAVIERFHEFHQRLYAHAHPDKPVEFVSGRIAAIGTMSAPPMRTYPRQPRQAVPDETRPVYFDETRSFEETAIHARSKLAPGDELAGPAVVEQIDTTTLIHPGHRASVDEFGNLLVSVGG